MSTSQTATNTNLQQGAVPHARPDSDLRLSRHVVQRAGEGHAASRLI